MRRNSDHGPSVREAGLSPELLQPGYQAEVGERAARAPDRDALDRLEREVEFVFRKEKKIEKYVLKNKEYV